MDIAATQQVREASLAIKVIRADGSEEDLGVVSYWHKNPLRRFWWRLSTLRRR